MNQMLELSNKGFKATIIRILRQITKKSFEADEKKLKISTKKYKEKNGSCGIENYNNKILLGRVL